MSQFPGYYEPPKAPAPYIVPDDAPPNPDAPWPNTSELPNYEKAAYQDMRKFHRLGRVDSAVSVVTFGGDNLRMNYALLGLLLGVMIACGVWWIITE